MSVDKMITQFTFEIDCPADPSSGTPSISDRIDFLMMGGLPEEIYDEAVEGFRELLADLYDVPLRTVTVRDSGPVK